MKRILILTAGFGEGHNSAARGVEAAVALAGAGEAEAALHDLFAECYGKANNLARKAYIELINRAPAIWQQIYNAIDRNSLEDHNLALFGKMRDALGDLLDRYQPGAIIQTYPVYGYLVDALRDAGHAAALRACRITVITDSISINSVWLRCGAEWIVVPNEATAEVVRGQGVDPARIQTLGFPVHPRFAEFDPAARRRRGPAGEWNVLYMISSGRQKSAAVVAALLARDDIDLTITVGRDEKLRARIEAAVARSGRTAGIIGWTDQMPELMSRSHLLIGKAGGATTQEALAAGCPLLITQVIPGQEEGNARLVRDGGWGGVAGSVDAIPGAVAGALADDARLLRSWLDNAGRQRRPDAALRIARFAIAHAAPSDN